MKTACADIFLREGGVTANLSADEGMEHALAAALRLARVVVPIFVKPAGGAGVGADGKSGEPGSDQ